MSGAAVNTPLCAVVSTTQVLLCTVLRILHARLTMSILISIEEPLFRYYSDLHVIVPLYTVGSIATCPCQG